MSSLSHSLDIRVFDPATSVLAAANAGAGKTRLLVNRVLALLLAGTPPSHILCLTYTNAAAAEMKSRVLGELGAWVMADEAGLRASLVPLLGREPDADSMLRARGLFAEVLEAPVGVRIETIHAFCQSLLRRFPIEAGVNPHFTVLEPRAQQELLQEARLRLFNSAYRDDPLLRQSIAALAEHLSENSLGELLDEIVAQKRKFRALFAHPGGLTAAVIALRQCLDLSHDATPETLLAEYFSYAEETCAQLRAIAGLLLAAEGKTNLATGQGLSAWLAEPSRRMHRVEEYVQVFITRENKKRTTLFTKKTLSDADLITALLNEQERVAAFHNRLQSLEVVRLSTHVLRVAQAFLDSYDGIKSAGARMDYDDLILAAEALLSRGMTPWVLFKLDGGIDHVLVDEAQDTSPEQWRIVSALTDEFFSGAGRSEGDRSLFIVGDEKQSIFSFQGADVAMLREMQRYFARRISEAGKEALALSLTHSFRSAPEILAAVDAIFAQPAARAGLMFEAHDLRHRPTRTQHAGLVELWPLTEAQEGDAMSPATKLAHAIADTIARWLGEGMMLEARGRALEPGDIMILVGKRRPLMAPLVRALKRRGVPVAGVDRMQLRDNLAVQDLIALGSCVLLPEDDLTLAALLKSPIFNVSEDELFQLAWQRGDKSLWERLRERGGESYALLADLRARADFIAPYELYAYLLDTLGARRRFIGRMGGEYADPIDEFMMQALLYEQDHPPSLQGFIHWMTTSDSEIKRDMEEARGAVRVMTVYAAKGLQAPVVILPDTTSPPTLDDRLLWGEGEGRTLPVWPRAAKYDDEYCRNLREAKKQSLFAEYRRLLYVALTRAEDRLYICGAMSRKSLSEESWYHLVRSGLVAIAPPFATEWGEGLRLGNNPSPLRGEARRRASIEKSLDERPHPMGKGIFAFLRAPAPAEPVSPRPLAPSHVAGVEPAAASPVAQEHVYKRGRLTHTLLQHLPGLTGTARKKAAVRLAAPYRNLLPPDVIEECVSEATAVMNDPQYAFLFAAGSLAEVPVAGNVMIGGRPVPVAGQVDRLAVGEREVWIADYKTSRLPPARPEDIPPSYLRQLALYRLLLRQIYPQKTVRCLLVWTAAGRRMTIDDALLDEGGLTSYI